MGYIVYVLILAMLAYICVKNFSLLKRYKFNKKYIECYRQVLKDEEKAYENVVAYIDSQKKEEYINKARILKLYVELKNDLEYENTLKSIDVSKIYHNDKGQFDKNLVVYNSDAFVFIMMVMVKAYAKLKFDVIIDLYDKVKAISELDKQVEYYEVLAVHNALLNKNDGGLELLNCLLNGEYIKYKYDKNMIGIYKRIAASILAFKSQTISDYDKDDLTTFSKSLIGKQVLSDLKIYDNYIESIEA